MPKTKESVMARVEVTAKRLALASLFLVVGCVIGSRLPVSTVFPKAEGQSTGEKEGQYIMAAGSTTTGQTEVYVFDVQQQKLAAYRTDGTGIGFRGVRQITWDLKPEEITPKGARLTVAQMKRI
jgi:hypothetical protein